MSSSLVYVAVAVVLLFSAAHSQSVHCGPEYGFPTLRDCHAALNMVAAVPNPGAQFLVGPRSGPSVPDVYLPISIQVGGCSSLCAPDHRISQNYTSTAAWAPRLLEARTFY